MPTFCHFEASAPSDPAGTGYHRGSEIAWLAPALRPHHVAPLARVEHEYYHENEPSQSHAKPGLMRVHFQHFPALLWESRTGSARGVTPRRP